MTTRRGFIGQAAGIGASVMFGAPAWAQVPDPRLTPVHPELRGAAAELLKMPPQIFDDAHLPQWRQGSSRWRRPRRADIPVERRMVAGGVGQPDVPVYIVNARSGAPRGAILHTHGGGYVLGSADNDVPNLQDIAAQLDCVIVSSDYRLAPETRWTGMVEDNYAALLWLYRNAATLGADPRRIAVMGESAGGGLAALLAITARDRGEVPLVYQCLTYPMLDDRTGSLRKMPPHIGQILWTEAANRYGWGSFLGVPAGSRRVPAAAVPARCANLRGLPPAFIGVGGIDLFVDEDVDYAQRLNAAGVATQLLVVPGAFHGFDMVGATTAPGKAFNAARLSALSAALAPA